MPEVDQGQPGGTQEVQGSTIQDWRAGLPDDLKAEKSLESFKDIGGLAKSYVEAQKMIGGSVRIPKADAKPEEWDAFYKKAGRPDKPEEYEVSKPPNMPEGMNLDENLIKWFLPTAHAAGLSKAQVAGLMEKWNERAFSQAHEQQKSMAQEITKLKEEWGPNFNGRVELGLRGIERLLKPEEASKFKELMDTTGLGNNPLMLKYAHLVGKMLKEDGYIMGDGSGGAAGLDAVKGKIKAINEDPKHAYWDEKHQGHKSAVDEMSKLMREKVALERGER
jgi:hypothetical protein